MLASLIQTYSRYSKCLTALMKKTPAPWVAHWLSCHCKRYGTLWLACMDNHCGFAQFLPPWQCSHWDANHRRCFSCTTCTSAVDIDMFAHVFMIVVMVSSRCLWFEKSLDRRCTSDLVQSSWHDSSNSTSKALAYGTKVTPVLPTKLCKANISWHKVADFLYACSRVSMIAQHTILFSQSLNSNRFSLCHLWASGPNMENSYMALHQTEQKS